MRDCLEILRRLRPYCQRSSRILVHEYVVGASGSQNLAASILGLHFVITTAGGRCFTLPEIGSLLQESLGFRLEFEQAVSQISSVIAFVDGRDE